MADWFEAGYLWQKSLLVGHEGWDTFSQLQAIASAASDAAASSPAKADVPSEESPLDAARRASSLVYIDDDGKVQGPFPADTVKGWTEAGMLPDKLRVRAAEWKLEGAPSGDEADGWVEVQAVFGMGQDEFEYVDDDGEVQGPFAAATVKGWIEAGYFAPSTRVRPLGGAWSTMDKVFKGVA
jgi:hypothetical protein